MYNLETVSQCEWVLLSDRMIGMADLYNLTKFCYCKACL